MTPTTVIRRDGLIAIDVKDRAIYSNGPLMQYLDALPEGAVQAIYESLQMTFWEFSAPELAKGYGYGEIYQEGHSGGWLVVEGVPPFWQGELDLDTSDQRQMLRARDKFRRFADAIEAEIDHLRDCFAEQVRERSERERREPALRAEAACRDIETVDP